jgi:hypothetical protein
MFLLLPEQFLGFRLLYAMVALFIKWDESLFQGGLLISKTLAAEMSYGHCCGRRTKVDFICSYHAYIM